MGIAAFGTLLKMGDGGATEVFTTVYEVSEITGPSMKAKVEDITNHSSSGSWAEKVVTTLDAGGVKFEINYTPANATHGATSGLVDALNDKTKKNWKLVFPDQANTTWLFSAYVTGFEPKAPVDGKLSASVELEISGAPTLV